MFVTRPQFSKFCDTQLAARLGGMRYESGERPDKGKGIQDAVLCLSLKLPWITLPSLHGSDAAGLKLLLSH